MAKGIYSAKNVRVLGGFVVLAALILAYVMYKPAIATHTPADKAYASGNSVMDVDTGTDVTILTSTFRTSKPTDLLMHVSLECAILTQLTTASNTTGGTSIAQAYASIRVWVEQVVRGIVPITSSSEPPQNGAATGEPGDEDDKVTFCQRDEGRRVQDTEDPQDEIDEQQTYESEKAANSFNWVLLNAGSGVYTYNVKADFVETPLACVGGASLNNGATCSDAKIGNRTFVVIPTKMANDISI
jgi:hypothetical protein